MKKNRNEKCQCVDCLRYEQMELSEIALHAFLGKSEPNCACERDDFEDELQYTNVLYWDVGQCGEERYCIYRDDEGNLLAWYDRANEIGYKQCSTKTGISSRLEGMNGRNIQ